MNHYTFAFTLFLARALCAFALEPESADKIPFVEQEVAFASGPITLSSTLLLPDAGDKVPAVVIIHGSGESDRSNPWTHAYAEALVRRGIAVLHPDKRGSGKSKGDWRLAGISNLADDALAAVATLRTHQRIDPARIGLIGFSQGVHVLPAAAARDSNVSFAIAISGSVVPMSEQISDEVQMSAERADFSDAQIKNVVDVNEKGMRFAQSEKDQDWLVYQSALTTAKQGDMKGSPVIERFPASRDHPAWLYLRSIIQYDPMPDWKKITLPSVFVYGGNDTQIRVQKSINRLQSELPAKKFNYSVLYFSKNGHALYRDDLTDFLARWILQGGKD